MSFTIADLKIGEKGIIAECASIDIPNKLIEMGCLPGNQVELLHYAPFSDPIFVNINGSYLAIRKETAALISIEKFYE